MGGSRCPRSICWSRIAAPADSTVLVAYTALLETHGAAVQANGARERRKCPQSLLKISSQHQECNKEAVQTAVVAVGRDLQEGICIRQDLGAKAQQQQLGLPGVPTGQHGLASSCAPAVGVILCCCGGIHEALVASCKSACSAGAKY